MIGLGWDEARRLGHHWIGEEHVLLSLSRTTGPAGEALRERGATPERVEQAIVDGIAKADPPVELRRTESPSPNPAWYSLNGRAEGLALARGADSAKREDVLVALLWSARLGASLLDALDVDRREVIQELGRRGVPVPPGQPEPLDVTPTKRVDVPYEHLMAIVRELPKRLPAGSRFGFNFHDATRRAWIVVDEGVDADTLVAAILPEGHSDG